MTTMETIQTKSKTKKAIPTNIKTKKTIPNRVRMISDRTDK